jgi:ubiquinone biosynthesis protein UbiJ
MAMSGISDDVLDRAIEHLVAQARLDSPRALALLQALQGRRLAIQLSGTPWHRVLESDGLCLRVRREGSADATLSAAPLSMLALLGGDAEALVQRGDVRIEGDAEVAQQYRELGLLLRPDVEDALSRVLGRSGAHLTMRGLRAAREWTRAAAWTSMQNLAEYLAHERRELVSRPEAEHFVLTVEQLREQLDRLDVRLGQLEHRMQRLAGPPEPD